MDVTIKVTGIEDCINFINDIPKLIENKNFKQYIGENCVKVINEIAEKKLKISSKYNASNKIKILKTGVLIYNDVKNDNGSFYSLIIEYGSGTQAEMEHIGATPKFIESEFEYWFVPEDVAPSLSQYSFKKIITKENVTLYMVFGSKGKHIYTEATQKISEKLSEWTKDYISKELLNL